MVLQIGECFFFLEIFVNRLKCQLQVLIKLQRFCHKLQSIDLSCLSLWDLQCKVELIYKLIDQCQVASCELNKKLETQQKLARNINKCVDKIRECVKKYEVKIQESHNNIQKIDDTIYHLINERSNILTTMNIHKDNIDDLKRKISMFTKQNNEIKNNIIENRNIWNEVKKQINNSSVMSTKTLRDIKWTAHTKLNKTNLITWILSIDKGYFCSLQFRPFIDTFKKKYHNIQPNKIDKSFLQKCGLTTKGDIDTFMRNYNQLLSISWTKYDIITNTLLGADE